MKNTARILVLVAATVLFSLIVAAQPSATPTPVKAEPDLEAMLAQVLDGQLNLEKRLIEIHEQLSSISKFLGDEHSSGFETVDRRLRDIAKDVEDLKR